MDDSEGPRPAGALRRFALNFGAFNVGQLGVSLLQFAFGIFLANAVGSAAYGEFAAVVALVAIFGGVLDFGLELVVVRDVARDRSRAPEHFGGVLAWRAALAIGVAFLVLVAAFLVGLPGPLLLLVAIFYVSTAASSIAGAGVVLLQGLEQFVALGTRSVLATAFTVATAIAFVLLGWGITGAFVAYAIGGMAQAAIFLPLAHRRAGGIQIPTLGSLRAMMAQAVPLGITSVLSTLHARLDRVLLTALVGLQAVGWYAAAFVLVQAMMDLIWSGFHKTFYPILSRASAHQASFARVIDLLASASLATFLGAAIVVSFLAPWIISILYPSGEFVESARLLALLVWVSVPTITWAVYRNVLLVRGRQRAYAWLTGGGLLANVGLTVGLISVFGIEGAAYAAITAQVLLLVATYFVVARREPIGFPWARMVRIAACAAGLALLLQVGAASGYGLPAAFLGVPLYGLALMGTKAFANADLKLVSEVVAR